MRRKKTKVTAYCPYEIGDKIQFEKGGSVNVMEVTDVITETSIKNGTSKFRLELDGWYMLDTSLHEVKVQDMQKKLVKVSNLDTGKGMAKWHSILKSS